MLEYTYLDFSTHTCSCIVNIVCELNFHRYGCVDERLEPCKKEKRRTPRKQIGTIIVIVLYVLIVTVLLFS